MWGSCARSLPCWRSGAGKASRRERIWMTRPILAVCALVFLFSRAGGSRVGARACVAGSRARRRQARRPSRGTHGRPAARSRGRRMGPRRGTAGRISAVGEEYEIAVEMASELARQGLGRGRAGGEVRELPRGGGRVEPAGRRRARRTARAHSGLCAAPGVRGDRGEGAPAGPLFRGVHPCPAATAEPDGPSSRSTSPTW